MGAASAVENIAWSFRWPDDAIDEGDFHHEVAEATGCGLLLDVGNLYANARNAGRDPFELLERYPLDRVAMVHVAGGVFEEGFYFDTHSHAVPDAVFELVAHVLARVGDVPIVLERDRGFPPFGEIERELSRLRMTPRSAEAGARPSPATHSIPATSAPPMALRQHAIATLLTAPEIPSDVTLARAHSIVQEKRAANALPLLPQVAAYGEAALALAVRSLEKVPRAPSMVAVSDAFRIADAAEGDTELRDAARTDALLLRARFSGEGDCVRPRVAPFIARARGASGVQRWVVKGIGANARVRVLERRGEP